MWSSFISYKQYSGEPGPKFQKEWSWPLSCCWPWTWLYHHWSVFWLLGLVYIVLGSPTCACPTLPDRSDRVAPIRRTAVQCNTHSLFQVETFYTKQLYQTETFYTKHLLHPQKQQCAISKKTQKTLLYLSEVHHQLIFNSWECVKIGGFVGDEISYTCYVLNYPPWN